MQKHILKDNWFVCDVEEVFDYAHVPENALVVTLPYDTLPTKQRDFSTVLGFENSYYKSTISCFFNVLPKLKAKHRIFLAADGVANKCNIYIDGKFVRGVSKSDSSELIDITDCYKEGATLCLRIDTHPDSDAYVGNGIMDNVCILAHEENNKLWCFDANVETKAEGVKTLVSVFVDIDNDNEKSQSAQIEVEIYKPNGKKLAKKSRIVRVPADDVKTFDVNLKLSNLVPWLPNEPYCYTEKVSLNGKLAQEFKFGVANHQLDKNNNYKLNGKAIKLVGAVVESNNALLGAAARYDFEYRKYSAIKALGYNAVLVRGDIQLATLDVLSDIGLLAIVSLCGEYTHAPRVSRASYPNMAKVRAVCNYPCVIAYSLHNCDKDIQDAVEWIKESDDSRPILTADDVTILENFKSLAMDFLGQKQPPADQQRLHVYTASGDLDVLACPKASASKNIGASGKNHFCDILVQDPDSVDPFNEYDNTTDLEALWNWPRHVGQPVKVVVHSSGDVVALWLNGKQVGRKLAGKFANNKAVFVTNFVSGKLEAISYFKGSEQSRTILATVADPKAIALSVNKKQIEVGEYAYIDITINDKNGCFIPFASRELRAEIIEGGEFIASQNTNPKGSPIATTPDSFYTYDGHALLAVKAITSGKLTVKVLGDGLNSGKILLRVK